MTNVVVIGSQWGDEGKGKIVDWLSHRADVVVRFQGGHNAGHTLVVDNVTYKLSLLPSGVVRKGKISIIGNGVVLDPQALLSEIALLQTQGISISPDNLYIADNVHLILSLHRHKDTTSEKALGKGCIGTTGRGIGPAYEDKIARRGIRLSDLKSEHKLAARVEHLLVFHNALRRGLQMEEVSHAEIMEELMSVRDILLSFAKPVWYELEKFRVMGKRILFEGAQGTLLDIDHGTYPFVTSSSTIASQASAGSGMGVKNLDYILGITKAYTTRVGNGPFPTEQADAIGQRLGEKGKEFGTVTQRKRRCGWFDAVLVRQSVTIGGINGIALTKLDVLDGIETLKICTGYEIDGIKYDYYPSDVGTDTVITPIYEALPGWQESTFGARSFRDLPASAIKYIKRIEELIGIPVAVLSTSPEREDTILVRDPFEH